MAIIPAAAPKKYIATVAAKENLTEKIVWLRLQTETPIPYREGQYANFTIGTTSRPLSFASVRGSLYTEFVIDTSPNGPCSKYVRNLVMHDSVEIEAPYGNFIVRDKTRPLLFIATGSGIAPLRAQLQAELASSISPPYKGGARGGRLITLVFGNEDENTVFFTEEFTALSQQHSSFSFIPILSSPSRKWQGTRGNVNDVVPQLINNLSDYYIYICGGLQMVEDMITALQTHHVPNEHIHAEQFT